MFRITKSNMFKKVIDCVLLFLTFNAIYISSLAVLKELDTLYSKSKKTMKPILGNGYRRKIETDRIRIIEHEN